MRFNKAPCSYAYSYKALHVMQVKQQGKAEDGMLDVEAVDWGQLCKYDIFQQMLNAAASSPTAQASLDGEKCHTSGQPVADTVYDISSIEAVSSASMHASVNRDLPGLHEDCRMYRAILLLAKQ